MSGELRMKWFRKVSRNIKRRLDRWTNKLNTPEKILEIAIMQIENELINMRGALAEAVASHKFSERQLSHYEILSDRLYQKAELAISQNNDSLAKKSLMDRQSYQKQSYSIKTELESQKVMIQELKEKLRLLENKAQEVRTKKNIYLARLRSATATKNFNNILNDFEENSSNNLFEILDNNIMELEAESTMINMGKEPDILERQFIKLKKNESVQGKLSELQSGTEKLD